MKKMSKIEKFEHIILNILTPDNQTEILCSEKELFNGQYETVLTNEFISLAVIPLINENIEENININEHNYKNWFCTGIAALLYFIQNNWTGPLKNEKVNYLLLLRTKAFTFLSLHDQYNENVVKPELLYLARIILRNNELHKFLSSSVWWLFRVNYIHQLILEELSETLFHESENLLKIISKSNLMNNTYLKILFNVEVSQFYFYYTRIQCSENYLEDARVLAKLNLHLEGALGKRTKYQEKNKAQLYLKAVVDKELFEYRTCELHLLPKVVNLYDDLRFEKVKFSEEIENVKLGSIEEIIIMSKFFQCKLSQPKDQLRDEEIMPYLNCIIDNTSNWPLKISALFQRCILESNDKRTINRSLSQLESLIEHINNSKTPILYRLDLFFATGMNPIWVFKQYLANLMKNIGLIKEALNLYLNLSLWDDVIVCYTMLEMRHKATEIIHQELAKKPTVKLWCLLGDIMEKVEHYQTAWKLSGEKSSRVQRHWGFYYYSKQNYKEAIPHLKLSIELNNLQENVLIRLGFAALQIEDWKLAASTYRKYCALEQSSFEIWNNLAKAYIKLDDKERAWHCLQDAIKCNFDKWEVWDNMMTVSTDLGRFSDVIRCYHRIIDIKGAHVDIQILHILSKAIINDMKSSDGKSAKSYLTNALELFGRLTALVSTDSDIWSLYAELTLLKNNDVEYQKAAQYFYRAHQIAISNPRAFKTIQNTDKILHISIKLIELYRKSLINCSFASKKIVLNKTKLCLQSVVKKTKDLQWDDQMDILEKLKTVEEHLKIIVEEMDKLNNADNQNILY